VRRLAEWISRDAHGRLGSTMARSNRLDALVSMTALLWTVLAFSNWRERGFRSSIARSGGSAGWMEHGNTTTLRVHGFVRVRVHVRFFTRTALQECNFTRVPF